MGFLCQQVHFIPGYQNKLLSASVDGLICLFDTSGDIKDDDHLDSVSRITYALFILLACLFLNLFYICRICKLQAFKYRGLL